MNKLEEIKKLVSELNAASDAYYNGKETLMTDAEFDLKLKQLSELEKENGLVLSNSPTVNVGAPVLDKLEKVKHEFKPMLSLNKCHSADEIIRFANGNELIAMVKMDGLSCRLTYENKKLIKAETRGDGEIGSLITEHVKQFKNIPLEIDKYGTYVIDGEAIITDEDFAEINNNLPKGAEKFKNSRNLASGTLALLDMTIVKKRKISFVAWDVIVGSSEKTIVKKLDEADKLGFECVPRVYGMSQHAISLNEKEVDKVNTLILKEAKDCGYLCDGVVWKFNDVYYGESLGRTSHHFNSGIAWKPSLVEYETELIDIEWSCSKNSINPVAIFKPTIVNGNTIEKASCHNVNYVEDLKLGVGDKITIYLANEIIPQINQNLTKSGTCKIPEYCPACGSRTEIICGNDGTKTLVCTNNACKSKLLGKLKTFVSKQGMDIDGLSEATLELLISRGFVKSFIDIYYLKDYKMELSALPRMGSKSVKKLLDSIEASRKTTLDKFIAALSIPHCGKSAAKYISKYCNSSVEKFISIMDNDIYSLMDIDGIGRAATHSLNFWWSDNKEMFLELLKELEIEVIEEKTETNTNSKLLDGMNFVVTGSVHHFKNRSELQKKIEELGGKIVGSVSAKTSVLLNNDVNSTSSKNSKAKSLNIPIWTEEQFLEYIN